MQPPVLFHVATPATVDHYYARQTKSRHQCSPTAFELGIMMQCEPTRGHLRQPLAGDKGAACHKAPVHHRLLHGPLTLRQLRGGNNSQVRHKWTCAVLIEDCTAPVSVGEAAHVVSAPRYGHRYSPCPGTKQQGQASRQRTATGQCRSQTMGSTTQPGQQDLQS